MSKQRCMLEGRPSWNSLGAFCALFAAIFHGIRTNRSSSFLNCFCKTLISFMRVVQI